MSEQRRGEYKTNARMASTAIVSARLRLPYSPPPIHLPPMPSCLRTNILLLAAVRKLLLGSYCVKPILQRARRRSNPVIVSALGHPLLPGESGFVMQSSRRPLRAAVSASAEPAALALQPPHFAGWDTGLCGRILCLCLCIIV